MRAYYFASKLTEHISETPEGYLICRDVPIARTGTQQYLGSEIDVEGTAGAMCDVVRSEEEVFSPATITSFEGKPATNDHPPVELNSQNAMMFTKGTTRDVRRGSGADSDKLFADLIIYDEQLIKEIKNGKREISCGYNSEIVEKDGVLYQVNIRGNHIAVVENGRAGSEVRIIDTKPKQKTVSIRKGTNPMAKKKNQSLVAKFLGMIQDADPVETAEIISALTDEEETKDEETTPTTDNETPVTDNPTDVMGAIKALADQVQSLTDTVAGLQAGTTDSDPLETLEQQLVEAIVSDNNEVSTEQDNLENPENMDEEPPVADEDPVVGDIDPTEDSETETIPTADKMAMLAHVQKMKPIIAGVKDAKQRKMLTDGLSNYARTVLKQPSKQSGGYANLLDTKQKKAQARSKGVARVNDAKDNELRQNSYDSRNPHKQPKK